MSLRDKLDDSCSNKLVGPQTEGKKGTLAASGRQYGVIHQPMRSHAVLWIRTTRHARGPLFLTLTTMDVMAGEVVFVLYLQQLFYRRDVGQPLRF